MLYRIAKAVPMVKFNKSFGYTINQSLGTSKKQSITARRLGKAPGKPYEQQRMKLRLQRARPIFTDAINNTGLATVTYLNGSNQQVRQV